MTTAAGRSRVPWLLVIVICTVIVVLVVPASGHSMGARFFSSLRIATPQAVTATTPASTGPTASRRLQSLLIGMLSDHVDVPLDEPDQPAATAAHAAALAGFTPHLPAAWHDSARFTVFGARTTTVQIRRPQLETILMEAGQPRTPIDPSIDGASVRIAIPRAIRAEHGNCPAPVAATLQNQLQGPPPPTTDNGSCVVLTESPPATLTAPASLDVPRFLAIALELSGMSPNQTRAFQQTIDASSAVTMEMPRGMRSYDTVTIAGARAMRLNLGARRGPTYELMWVRNGLIHALAGYGIASDAPQLASSIR